MQAADLPDHFAFLGVDHIHFRAMRDVDAPARRVRDQIIPAAFTADGNFLDLAIAALRKRRGQNEERQECSTHAAILADGRDGLGRRRLAGSLELERDGAGTPAHPLNRDAP